MAKTYIKANQIDTADLVQDETMQSSFAFGSMTPDGWVLTGASYDNVSFDFTAQIAAGGCNDITFSPDGTHMFVLNDDDIYHYTLSTAWDITTASFSESKIGVAEDSTFGDLFFKPDGTKLYLISAPHTVWQYTLSPAWDISSMSYDSVSFSFGTRAPTGLYFRSDGLRAFAVDITLDRVYQLELDTAWDVSTMRRPGFYIDTTGVTDDPQSLSFSNDGRKLLIIDDLDNNIKSYDLSTPWDIETATVTGVNLSVASQTVNPIGMFAKSDGSKLFICGDTDGKIFQYSMSGDTVVERADSTTVGVSRPASQAEVDKGDEDVYYVTPKTLTDWGLPVEDMPTGQWSPAGYNTTNAYYDDLAIDMQFTGSGDPPGTLTGEGHCWSDDGLHIYLTSATANPNLWHYTLTTPWDLTTIDTKESYDMTINANAQGIFVKPGGGKMWSVEVASEEVHEYILGGGSPDAGNYDIAGATYSASYTCPGTTNLYDLTFKSDGTMFWVVEQGNDLVKQYNLSTPWDITTASNPGIEYDLTADEALPYGLNISEDGTRMLIVGDGAKIIAYELTTPYDVSTATLIGTPFDLSNEMSNAHSIFAHPDGGKCWITTLADRYLRQYDIRGSIVIDAATETTEGVVELATQAEVNAGTDTERAVTPATLQEKALDTAILMSIVYGI